MGIIDIIVILRRGRRVGKPEEGPQVLGKISR
jgi:hypothetical protein